MWHWIQWQRAKHSSSNWGSGSLKRSRFAPVEGEAKQLSAPRPQNSPTWKKKGRMHKNWKF